MDEEICPGPLIWFGVGNPETAGILECATCSYIVTTGCWNDERHAQTPFIKEGLAY